MKTGGLKRVFRLVWSTYKWQCIVVFVLIVFSALVTVYGSTFQRTLIDDYILPLQKQADPDYAPLTVAILQLAGIYIAGIISTYVWNRLMVTISLGTLNEVREKLFAHMESLPLRYFDTNAHGDIMSVYTNDTDTLRQLISQSVPQMISSGVTILLVMVSMLLMGWQLALITLVCSSTMLFVARRISRQSGKYFMSQQQQLGKVNGYIEEMIEGTRVVKVFNHENKVIDEFGAINDRLCEASTQANIYANILMPICMNLGYLSYVITAISGAYFAINGMFGITLGSIAAILTLNRSFNQPIAQISQQVNSIVMAGAGASRIFELMDQKPETDSGTVTLVRSKMNDGQWIETQEYTGHWCWKHPRANGAFELVPLEGNVVFDDVTDRKSVV